MIQLTSSDIVKYTLWILISFSAITWGIIFFKSWVFWTLGRARGTGGQRHGPHRRGGL
jgi:biopolymer transport protein ExbB